MVPSFFMNDHVAQEIQVRRLVTTLRWALLGVAVVAASLGAFYFWKMQKQKSAEAAFDLLHKATQIEERAGREGSTLQKDAMDVMLSWPEAQRQEYVKALESVESQYSKKSAGLLATLKKARFQLLSGQHAQALEAYQSALSRSAGHDSFELYYAMAAEGAAASLELVGRLPDAKTLLDQALSKTKSPLRPVLFLSLARLQIQLGEKDRAAETYDKIIKEFPNSEYEKRARALKLRAG